MERGSDKHNPELDEEMKKETEHLERGQGVGGRVEDFREIEPVDAEEEGEGLPLREEPEPPAAG